MNRSFQLYGRVLEDTKRYAKGYGVVLFGMLVAAVTEPMFPAMMKLILDEGFVARTPFPLWLVPAGIIGIFVVRGIAVFASHYALAWVTQKTLVDIRRKMFAHVLRLPAAAFENEAAGVLISRVVFEINNVLDAANAVLTIAVRDTLIVVALMGYLFWINWKLTLVALVLIPTLAVTISVLGKRMRKLNRTSLEHTAELTRVVEESVHGYKVIKIFGGYDREAARFARTTDRLRGYAMRMTVAGALTTPITQLLAASAVATVVGVALVQSQTDQTTVGTFASFITAMLMLLSPLKHIADVNAPLQRGLAAAEKVFELLDRTVEDDTGTRTVGRVAGEVRFENVGFRYPGAVRDALTGIDLVVRPGEIVALVGPSGGGKTTIANLVPRFIHATSGRVLIDGMPVEELTLASLRDQIALVSQDIVLFNDTLRENVAYGCTEPVSDERIFAALADAALDEFARSLPEGLDTMIGERGAKMSGGQRQRLAIARAVLKNAPILLLDEATSALDAETEREIQRALDRTMKERTTIVIAHRLSTIEHADRIVVLDGGRIAEQGRHAELMAAGGVYARLQRQHAFETPSADA